MLRLACHPLHDLGVLLDPSAPTSPAPLYAAFLTEKTVYRRAFFGTSKPFTHAWGLYYEGKLLRWGFSSSMRNARAASGAARSRAFWYGRDLDRFDVQIVQAVEVL